MKRFLSILFCLIIILLWANPIGQLGKPPDTSNLFGGHIIPVGKPLQFKQIRVPLTKKIDDLLVYDFNGDGYADIVTLQEREKKVTEFMGDTNQNYMKKYTRKFPDAHDLLIGAADFDGDGNMDVAAECYPREKKYLAILFGKGNGRFGKPKIVKTNEEKSHFLYNVVTLDFNGDGKLDILGKSKYTYPRTIVAFLNLGRKKFEVIETQFSVDGWIVPGDFDNDGMDDFIGLYPDYWRLDTYTFFHSNGNGTFKKKKTKNGFHGMASKYTKAADLDGDGRLDLVGVYGSGLWTMKGLKDVKFEKYKIVKGSVRGDRLLIVDLNKDNKPDIVTSSPTSIVGEDELWIYTNKGKGKFDPPTKLAEHLEIEEAKLNSGDLNNDRKPDIIIPYPYSDESDILLFINGKKPATLTISNLVITEKRYMDVLYYGAYISGSFSFSGSGIDLKYTGKEGAMNNAYIKISAYFDYQGALGWPNKYGHGFSYGAYLHRPGQNFGTIYFNNVFVPTGSLGTYRSPTPTIRITSVYLIDYNLIRSNRLPED